MKIQYFRKNYHIKNRVEAIVHILENSITTKVILHLELENGNYRLIEDPKTFQFLHIDSKKLQELLADYLN